MSPRGGRPLVADAPQGFGRAAGWTVLGTLVPGLGLLRHRRRLGLTVLGAFTALVLGLLAKAALDLPGLLGWAANPSALRVISAALVVLALAWVTTIAGTWLVNRPRGLSAGQRAAGGVLVGLLSLLVSGPLLVASHDSRVQAGLIGSIFTGGRSQTRPDVDAAHPWQGKARVNVLLAGGDSASNRKGLRTDTMMVASIDTTSGDTTIIQVPRNMARMPFPEGTKLHEAYPDGFYDGVSGANLEYMATEVWENVPEAHPELFANTEYPGADALKMGLSATTGLDIDYFVMVNMAGLQKLIDAMGGVTVNVNRRIPVAGNDEGEPSTGWIEPGPNRHLNGYYAMWFGRSRKGSTDFDRMARQSCVIKAVIDQASPMNVLANYESIAKAGGNMVMTDIPQPMLQSFVQLGLKVKDAQVRRVMFIHGKDGFDSTDPDYPMMRRRIQAALGEAHEAPAAKAPASSTAASQAPTTTPASAPPSSPTTTATSRASASSTPTASSEDIADACAYHPEDPSAQPSR